jgi:hypothetical protein
MNRGTLSVVFFLMIPIFVHSGTLFEDNFNRTELGSNWSYGGTDPAKAYINENGQLRLDEAGPVYYTTPVGTGTPWTKQTIEFNLVQPSPSGDIGCYVDFGLGSGNVCGFQYIFAYDVWCPVMYLTSSQSGVVGQIAGFADLRGRNAYIVVEIETMESGSSTASFSAYTDSSKLQLIATAGPWSIPAALQAGQIGFSLPNNYWSGLIVDNFKVTQTLVAEKPTFSPSGKYISGPTAITVLSGTTGASIYYTLDGSTPTSVSTLYTAPVMVSNGTTLRAIALAEGFDPSEVTTETFLFQIPVLAWSGIPPYLSSPGRFNELKEAGFTHHLQLYSTFADTQVALDCAQGAGIKMVMNPIGSVDTYMQTFRNHPALEAYYLSDEPGAWQFADLANKIQTIRYMDRRHWCYINLLPNYASPQQWGVSSYESYVNTFLETVPVEVLSFDHYPILSSGVRPGFYKNLDVISTAAREKNIPFWGFALSVGHYDYPVPTLTHLRHEIYSHLAYGAQGIQYFTYWTVSNDFQQAPIALNGERTPTYQVVQSMNQELKGVGHIFRGARILSIGHTGAVLPEGTAPYVPLSPIISLTTQGDGAVVSRLVNDRTWYLSVVNRDIHNVMGLNLTVDTGRGISKVAKEGSATALGSATVSYTVDPGDILVLKWDAIPGDSNMDDAVDVGDLGILAANYGGLSKNWSQGDFNNDGCVDVGDLGILAANYGTNAGNADWSADYAKAFGVAADDGADATKENELDSSFCGGLGLPLLAGLLFAGLLLMKLDE